jgi:TalC/MipB family fructose-6-phosphate aldolase
MEFLFDTASIEKIKKYGECFAYTGVTSNPSIIKACGKIDFFNHFREIRNIIGEDRSLHIQVLSENYEGILKEADAILKGVDDKVFIKVPTTEEGLKAMMELKRQGISVTATAIYSKIQGILAINAGADFIAPYFNRMENLDINAGETIAFFADAIFANSSDTKILAASFKNIAQVNAAISAGTQTVTVDPALIGEMLAAPTIKKAVDDFRCDWEAVFGDKGILDLR